MQNTDPKADIDHTCNTSEPVCETEKAGCVAHVASLLSGAPGRLRAMRGKDRHGATGRASAQWRHAADQELVVGKNRLTSKACRASTGCCTVNADTPVLKMPAFSLAISCNVCTHLRYCNGT